MVLDRQLDIKSVTDLDTQLDSKLASGGIIITIVNWHTYQDSEKTVGQPVGQDVGQSFGHGNGHGKVQQSEEGYSEEGFQKKKKPILRMKNQKPNTKIGMRIGSTQTVEEINMTGVIWYGTLVIMLRTWQESLLMRTGNLDHELIQV